MAQYWFKKDKRVKRKSDILTDLEIKQLKVDGYVQVSDRHNPEGSILKPKPKAKPKPKTKKK